MVRSWVSFVRPVAGYALLPGFWPRLVGFVPRFSMMAYFMALIFEMVRLLPSGHPLLNPARMETYRIRDVMAAAANNLKGGFKNSDQYLIFAMFLIGIVIMGIQFVLIASLIVVGSAHAAGIPFVNMFVTAIPAIDIAHLMLDRVFGIPEFFNSCFDPTANAAAGAACDGFIPTASFPTPFQQAMQWLFEFYNFGMLAVAGFLILYYIFAMLAETVNTGKPFGQRFQSFYTPIRLVWAILLMLPLAYGFSTGQYIVLWAAKWGSGVATNAWYVFNNRAGDNPLGLEPQQLVGAPKVQDIESVINFFYVAHTCKAAYAIAYQDNDTKAPKLIQAYLVRPAGDAGPAAAQQVTAGTNFAAARAFYGQGDVNIVFGEQNAAFTKYPGNVKPYCGVINIPTLSKTVSGIDVIYDVYFAEIMALWADNDLASYGGKMSCNLRFADKPVCNGPPAPAIPWGAPNEAAAGQSFYQDFRISRQATYTAQMDAAINTVRTTTNPETTMDAKTQLYGWGGAGFWFNKVASFNSALVDSLMILPTPTAYPMIMEHIATKKKFFEANTDPKDKYSPTTSSGGKTISLDNQIDDADLDQKDTDIGLAKLFDSVYKEVQHSEATAKPRIGNSDSFVKTWMVKLFGQSGLFNFQANGEVFPLVKLTMLGREIIDKTIIMMGAAGIISGFGGLAGAGAGSVGSWASAASTALWSFATIGIVAGIALNYVVPFMPFIYFFFAVGRWVKSIFEAMVAIPLWAMAHLRLGGEGIPGSAAATGYFLILEIFLRPIITVFGLLAAVAIFAAMCVALDSVFSLLVMNTGGFDMTTLSSGGPDIMANAARDGADALFYTAAYAMIVYIIANSSFKLIDLFPNSIMRWAGMGVSSFNDNANVESQVDLLTIQKPRQMIEELKHEGQSFSTKMMNRNLSGGGGS